MAPTTVASFTHDKLQASKQANKQKRCIINEIRCDFFTHYIRTSLKIMLLKRHLKIHNTSHENKGESKALKCQMT